MNDYYEVEKNTINSINIYKSNKKYKKKILIGIVSSLCFVCLVALISFGVRQIGCIDSALPNSETDKNTTYSTRENPMNAFNVISLSHDSNEEFAADIYRPEGFNDNIGSALALKMSIVDDVNYEFSVIVHIPDKTNLEQVLNEANKSVSIAINFADATSVSISGTISATDKYYYLLTAEQIIALADNGAKCYYVGSGEGDYKYMNWDTVEGIDAYCELHGDMYIADNNYVKHSPDIFIE